MLQESGADYSQSEFQTRCLAALLGELSAQWGAVLCKTPEWVHLIEAGRRPQGELPWQTLEEALDQNAAGWIPETPPRSMPLIIVPINSTTDNLLRVLVLKGRKLAQNDIAAASALARILGLAIDMHSRNAIATERIRRLEETIALTAKLSNVDDTTQLLELLAEQAMRLFTMRSCKYLSVE